VESSNEGPASMGVIAGGEEASESGSSEAEVVRMRETDCTLSGGGISIGHAIGFGAPCILSSLPGNLKHEKLFHDRNGGVSKPRRDGAFILQDSEANSDSGK
jgi:hypothetical protein